MLPTDASAASANNMRSPPRALWLAKNVTVRVMKFASAKG
jgi:hypothetical protein